jgi:hypothetical protein
MRYNSRIMGKWIKSERALPERGEKVLVWFGEGAGRYDIASVDEGGAWIGLLKKSVLPAYWTPLPEPPSESGDAVPAAGIRGEVIDGRLMLDIAEDKESVAELMQCYINGEEVFISGERFLVADIKNEIIGEKVISVFFLRRSGLP